MNYHPAIRVAQQPWYGLTVPYDAAFLDELKGVCPVLAWDAESQTWWIPGRNIEAARVVVSRYWPDEVPLVPTARAPKADPRLNSTLQDAYGILGVERDALDSVVAAARDVMLREFAESDERCERIEWACLFIQRSRGI